MSRLRDTQPGGRGERDEAGGTPREELWESAKKRAFYMGNQVRNTSTRHGGKPLDAPPSLAYFVVPMFSPPLSTRGVIARRSHRAPGSAVCQGEPGARSWLGFVLFLSSRTPLSAR